MSSQKKARLVDTLSREVRKFIAGAILFNQRVAEQVGLNSTDLQCLHVLELQGSATPGELARWSGLTTGGVTVVLDRLEKAGYIERDPNPADRRSWIIRPVRAPMRKLEGIYRSKGEMLLRVLAGLSEDRLRAVLDFFSKINTADAGERKGGDDSSSGRDLKSQRCPKPKKPGPPPKFV